MLFSHIALVVSRLRAVTRLEGDWAFGESFKFSFWGFAMILTRPTCYYPMHNGVRWPEVQGVRTNWLARGDSVTIIEIIG